MLEVRLERTLELVAGLETDLALDDVLEITGVEELVVLVDDRADVVLDLWAVDESEREGEGDDDDGAEDVARGPDPKVPLFCLSAAWAKV